jgi:hypothetical protein
MKLVKIFCLALLLAMSAAAVKAGSIGNNDPKVVINCGKPPCGSSGTVLSNFQSGDPMVAVIYNGTAPISSLTIDLSAFYVSMGKKKALAWSPFSNIFNGNAIGIKSSSELFDIFSGASSPMGSQCMDAAGGAANIGCPGMIFPGETIDVSVLFGNSMETGTVTLPTIFSCVGSCTDGNLTVRTTGNVAPTPEPSTMLMFLSLGPAIGFAKKRWNARNAS